MPTSGYFYPGTVSATITMTSGPSLPGGVTVAAWHYRLWIDDVTAQTFEADVQGNASSGSCSYYNTSCGHNIGGSGYVEAFGSDGTWYTCGSVYNIYGTTVMPSASGSITLPIAGAQNDFPTVLTGSASGTAWVTLTDTTTSTPVTLGTLVQTGGWSVPIVGALTHGHSYRVLLDVAGGDCLSGVTRTRDFSIPTYFTRVRDWAVTSALGPIVSQVWNITANINKYAVTPWYLYSQLNSPLSTAPTRAEIDSALSTLHRFRCRLWIRWDRTEWVEESERLFSASGVNDVDFSSRYLNTAEATLELDNSDDRFTIQNRASPIYTNLQRIGQEVRLTGGYDGYETTILYGRVDAITPSMSERSCSLHVFDVGAPWKDLKALYAPNALVTTDEVLRSILSQLGLTEGVGFVLDVGDALIPYAIAPGVPLLEDIQALAQAEGGRVFFDENGVLIFWSRSHTRRVQAVPVVELNTDDHLYEISRSTSPAGLSTRVSMEWETRDAQVEEIVFDLKNDIQLSGGFMEDTGQVDEMGYAIEYARPGASVGLLCKPMDLTRWEKGMPAEFTTIHTITANTQRDGGGTNIPCVNSAPPRDQTTMGSGKLYYEFMPSIGSAGVSLAFMGYGVAYITVLKIRGLPQRAVNPVAVTAVDPEAVLNYGDIELTLSNPYTPDADVAMDRAREELAIRKDPLAVLNIPLQDGIPFLRTFDVIRVTDRSVPNFETVSDGQVLRNDWTIDPDEGYTQQLALGAATPAQYRGLMCIGVSTVGVTSSQVGVPFKWGSADWSFAQWN